MAQQHDRKDRWKALIQRALNIDHKRILQQHKEDYQSTDLTKDEPKISRENFQSTGLTKDETQTSRESLQPTSSVKDERQTNDKPRREDCVHVETSNLHGHSHQSTKPILMLHRSSYRASQVTPQLGIFVARCEKEIPRMDEKLFRIKELIMELGERLVDLDTEFLQLE